VTEREQLSDGETRVVVEGALISESPFGATLNVEFRNLEFPAATYRMTYMIGSPGLLGSPCRIFEYKLHGVRAFVEALDVALDGEVVKIPDIHATFRRARGIVGQPGALAGRVHCTRARSSSSTGKSSRVSVVANKWLLENCQGDFVRPLNRIRYLGDHPAQVLELDKAAVASQMAAHRAEDAAAQGNPSDAAAWKDVADRVGGLAVAHDALLEGDREAAQRVLLAEGLDKLYAHAAIEGRLVALVEMGARPFQQRPTVRDRALASLSARLGDIEP
jgi:hypothetical protein